MKRLLLILALLPIPCHAAGPLFRHSETHLNQEFDNIYQDLKAPKNAIPSLTLAQLKAFTPMPSAGSIFYCSDCTTDGIVVSTGTGQGAFARISARTTSIN